MAAERSGEDDRDNLRAEVLTPAEGETQFATHTVGPGETIGGAPAGEASAGAVIGFYRLEQPIGRGGMGEVWLAEQEQPVRRRVAIKLIKAGMDTREVVARFEAERQTLALMDHPPSPMSSTLALLHKDGRIWQWSKDSLPKPAGAWIRTTILSRYAETRASTPSLHPLARSPLRKKPIETEHASPTEAQ